MKLIDVVGNQLNENLDDSDNGYSSVQEIKAELQPYLQHEIAKLNRKAQKLGTPPITMNVTRTFFKDVKDSNPPKKEKWIEVEIEGPAPNVPGYEFLGTIEHKGAGNIIRTVPGVSEANVKNFYDAKPDYCDHCKKKRQRIDTFIIKDQKSGELRQIGRNCLADFLGGRDPKAILFWFARESLIDKIFDNADSYGGPKRGRAEYSTDPDTILNTAGALIKEYGYRKNDGYGSGDSTSYVVKKLIFFGFGHHKQDQEDKRMYMAAVDKNKEAGKELASKAKDWFNSIPDDEKENNNFYHSIDVLLKSDNINPRDVGYLAAIFPAYDRAMGEVKAKETKSNEWIGTPGDKIPKTKVTVTKTMLLDPYTYGAREPQLVKMEDDAGNSYTWFNSSANRLEEDKSYYIIGTIKKHDEYRGRKTTVLLRVKAAPV